MNLYRSDTPVSAQSFADFTYRHLVGRYNIGSCSFEMLLSGSLRISAVINLSAMLDPGIIRSFDRSTIIDLVRDKELQKKVHDYDLNVNANKCHNSREISSRLETSSTHVNHGDSYVDHGNYTSTQSYHSLRDLNVCNDLSIGSAAAQLTHNSDVCEFVNNDARANESYYLYNSVSPDLLPTLANLDEIMKIYDISLRAGHISCHGKLIINDSELFTYDYAGSRITTLCKPSLFNAIIDLNVIHYLSRVNTYISHTGITSFMHLHIPKHWSNFPYLESFMTDTPINQRSNDKPDNDSHKITTYVLYTSSAEDRIASIKLFTTFDLIYRSNHSLVRLMHCMRSHTSELYCKVLAQRFISEPLTVHVDDDFTMRTRITNTERMCATNSYQMQDITQSLSIFTTCHSNNCNGEYAINYTEYNTKTVKHTDLSHPLNEVKGFAINLSNLNDYLSLHKLDDMMNIYYVSGPVDINIKRADKQY